MSVFPSINHISNHFLIGTGYDYPDLPRLGNNRVLEIYFLVSVIRSDTLQNFVSPNKLLSVRNNFKKIKF